MSFKREMENLEAGSQLLAGRRQDAGQFGAVRFQPLSGAGQFVVDDRGRLVRLARLRVGGDK
jgi:hypothetical protein